MAKSKGPRIMITLNVPSADKMKKNVRMVFHVI
jgi:hypothetical protein